MPYTPGPWFVGGSSGTPTTHPQLTIESNFGQIAEVVAENCDIDGQIAADAALLAAAPDLFKACLAAENWLTEYETGPDSGLHDLLAQLRAAITTARGTRL